MTLTLSVDDGFRRASLLYTNVDNVDRGTNMPFDVPPQPCSEKQPAIVIRMETRPAYLIAEDVEPQYNKSLLPRDRAQAMAAFKRKDYWMALNGYNMLCISDPSTVENWYYGGLAAEKLHRFKLAEDGLRRAVEMKPGNKEYLRSLGDFYVARQQKAKAVELLNSLLKKPNLPPADEAAITQELARLRKL